MVSGAALHDGTAEGRRPGGHLAASGPGRWASLRRGGWGVACGSVSGTGGLGPSDRNSDTAHPPDAGVGSCWAPPKLKWGVGGMDSEEWAVWTRRSWWYGLGGVGGMDSEEWVVWTWRRGAPSISAPI
jgi:hypothetical protein